MVGVLQLRSVDGMVVRRKAGVVSLVSENSPRYLWKHCNQGASPPGPPDSCGGPWGGESRGAKLFLLSLL
jgi:hypothetical protein